MPVASKVKVGHHLRRVGGKVYKVRNYIRTKRPIGRKVKKYVPVGTLEIGHDKFGNIIDNRVVISKPKSKKGVPRRNVKRRRLSGKELEAMLDKMY